MRLDESEFVRLAPLHPNKTRPGAYYDSMMTKGASTNATNCTTAIWSHEPQSVFMPVLRIPIQSREHGLYKALKTNGPQSQEFRQTDKIALRTAKGRRSPRTGRERCARRCRPRPASPPGRFRQDRPAAGNRAGLYAGSGLGGHAERLRQGLDCLRALLPDGRGRPAARVAATDRALQRRSGGGGRKDRRYQRRRNGFRVNLTKGVELLQVSRRSDTPSDSDACAGCERSQPPALPTGRSPDASRWDGCAPAA